MSIKKASILLILFSLLGSQAFAWGRQGHEIVAEIAQDELSPATLHAIDALRQQSVDASALHPNEKLKPFQYIDTNLSQFLEPRVPLQLSLIANWADGWRNREPKTAPWHFIDLPIDSPASVSSEAAYCQNDACVVRQIEIQGAILGSLSSTAEDRLKALFFVVHFVGDVHQPLHCANDQDRGGNDRKVKFFGKTTNLHHIWDSNIIEAQHQSVDAIAKEIEGGLSEEEKKDWSWGPPENWALESHALAVDPIYAAYPQDGSIPNYGEDYEAKMFPMVKTQLAKAGIRLARLLNGIFEGSD